MFNRQLKQHDLSDKNDFLISISDLMTGIMMIFVLTLIAVLYSKTTDVVQYIREIESKKEKLAKIQSELDHKTEQLKFKENALDSKEIELKFYKDQIEKIIGIKGSIINLIKEKFERSSSNLKLAVDPFTGAIRISGDILFDTDSDTIKEEFKPLLKLLLETYVNILFDTQEFIDHLAEIVIEGHADNRGDYIYNLDLSQRRAQSIMKYFIQVVDPSKKDLFQKFVTANGKSFSVPIKDQAGNVDLDKSRRIEVKFRLKDDEALKELSKLLDQK